MQSEEIKEELDYLFHPEPDEDGFIPREFPNSRLSDKWRLNFDYMNKSDWEGSSGHKYTRLCPEDEVQVHALTRSQDIPERLFTTALRLFADSMIEYNRSKKRHGDLRYYPSVILTFWSGFETFVRHMSELLIITAAELPTDIARYLREEEASITSKGEIKTRTRYSPLLDRYAVFLKYAYGYEVNRGASFWQSLDAAKGLRDYYTHLNVSEPRSVKAAEILEYLEAILLGLIIPSSHLQRTLMLGQYWLYQIWAVLNENYRDYTERPFFLEWHLQEQYLFHCNFENVNKKRFPSMREQL